MPGPKIDLTVYDDDIALLDGLRRQDPDACTCLMKRFAPLVYARALGLTNDPDEAEGVFQTTFIKVCNALGNFDGASSLSTWIYRVATNEGLMALRSRKQHLPLDNLADTLPADTATPTAGAAHADPQHIALNAELRAQIETALTALPASLQQVVRLRDFAHLSTEETAERLGITPGTVKVRLHRARLRLRDALATYLAAQINTDA